MQCFVAEPGHGRWGVGQAGLEQEGIVGAFVEGHQHAVGFDRDGCGDVQQVTEKFFRLGVVVAGADFFGQQTVERAGDQRRVMK